MSTFNDGIEAAAGSDRLHWLHDELSELARLRLDVASLVEALTDIAVYGCGMLNQPAAMNGPEEAWLRHRIAEYERVARAALSRATDLVAKVEGK